MYNIGYVLLPTFWGWLASLMMRYYAPKMEKLCNNKTVRSFGYLWAKKKKYISQADSSICSDFKTHTFEYQAFEYRSFEYWACEYQACEYRACEYRAREYWSFEHSDRPMPSSNYFSRLFNMRGKYQTGKIQKWVLANQKTYLAKNFGNMGRTSDPIGQMHRMDTWATSLG